MKFSAFLFVILVFITSFAASIPVLADEDALEARLEDQVGAPVLITEVDTAADAKNSTPAAKHDGRMKKNGKKNKDGKKKHHGKKKHGGKNGKNGGKKDEKAEATGGGDHTKKAGKVKGTTDDAAY